MQLYKSRLEQGKSHRPPAKTPLEMFSTASTLAGMARWTPPQQPTGKNPGAIAARRSRPQCGPGDDHILLWCVWVRPSAGPAQSDRNLPLLTRLNHCLPRQEGCPLYDIIRCLPAAAPCLRLTCGFGNTRFVFSPTAKFLKVDTS